MNRREDDAQPPLEERVQRIEDLLNGDGWAGRVILRGTLPRGVVRDVLPTAAATFQYDYITIRGVSGSAADVTYQCLKDAAGAWGWRVVATG